MASIVIVSGCPGSGKTTLSHALARSQPSGVHIVSDVFYGFPAAPVDPTRKESHHQNTVIMRALRRVRERQGPSVSARVRHMVAAFAELGELRSHAVDTARRTLEEVLRIAQQGLAEGRFRLDG